MYSINNSQQKGGVKKFYRSLYVFLLCLGLSVTHGYEHEGNNVLRPELPGQTILRLNEESLVLVSEIVVTGQIKAQKI